MKISVCIPIYEQRGLGKQFLKHNLDVLSEQTFDDFEVIVTDDSTYFVQGSMQLLCNLYPFVKYFRNTGKKGIASNTNFAMSKATGELIKIIYQDDFLYNKDSLQDIWDNFKGNWMITACESTENGKIFIRPFYPHYNPDIYLGNNTISSPSVLTVRNHNHLLFDENLSMLIDVDYYKRLYDKFGEPTILNKINVVNSIGSHQESMNITPEQMDKERKYVRNKYNQKE